MRLASLAPFVLFTVAAACSGATANGPNVTTGVGLGGDCDDLKQCREPLLCTAAKCTAAGTTKNGEPCVIGAECASGVCAPAIVSPMGALTPAKCQEAAGGAEGAGCRGDADCGKGLRCGFDGTSFFPKCMKEGSSDRGGTCAKNTDCLQGLMCMGGVCDTPRVPEDGAKSGVPPYVPMPGAWSGAKCEENVKGDITALFQVPRAGEAPHEDFYRLPFPNDAARSKATGKVSFANHPHDPAPPMGFDAVKLYLDALEPEPFSNSPTVFFRFNGDYDFGSLEVSSMDPQTRFVDLTAGPDMGRELGLSIWMTNGRNRYICSNYVSVRPGAGASLTPGHTYGVIMLNRVKGCSARGSDGKCTTTTNAKQHPDFTAMVAAAPPADGALKDAYDAYKPLRDWMVSKGKKADDLLVATVFTVGDPGRVAARLRNSVRTAAAPKAEGWVKCASGVKSPCAQADEAEKRACGAGEAEFDEYHALVEVPIFQQGTAPYLTPKDGGAMNASGGPNDPIAPVRTEKVCMAVTVPKGTPPTNGWPVAIYAHGTGGSFRSHAIDGSGKMLAAAGLATVGIDQVQHGPRRGTSTMSPNDLFFNFANPAAARYNAQQGAADQHALVRLLESLSITDGTATIKLDGSKAVFWGHSQGATEGSIFLAGDTNVRGAVFSGQGASLGDALTTKTSPVNIKDVMWIALSEAHSKAVDGNHPVIALLQAWADPADPLHYARKDVVVPGSSPTTPALLRNVFQLMGKDDTFTPLQVQANFAMAAGLLFVGPKVIDEFPTPAASAEGNIVVGTMKSTAAFRQYAPPTMRDGHFVAFDVDQARTDVTKFLVSSSKGLVPKLPE